MPKPKISQWDMLSRLKPGDAIFVSARRRSIESGVRRTGKKFGQSFSVKKIDDGTTRVLRLT